jgi:hypothetical protein
MAQIPNEERKTLILDRRVPRHRACHGEALLLGWLAGDHLLASRLSRGLPLGGGAG